MLNKALNFSLYFCDKEIAANVASLLLQSRALLKEFFLKSFQDPGTPAFSESSS